MIPLSFCIVLGVFCLKRPLTHTTGTGTRAVWYWYRSPSLSWYNRARVARATKILMPQALNWAGWPIKDGESYGGKPEHISGTCSQKPAQAAAKHYELITEGHVCKVFGNGAYKFTRAEAAKRLELLTGVHRTTCYRALTLTAGFARHLRAEGTMLTWR
jgi:hypothetical protein